MKTITKGLFLLTNVCLIAMLVSCRDKNEKHSEIVKYVKTTEVKSGSGNKFYSFSGKVEELKEVNLSFRVGGPMTILNVREGDYVKEGDIIAEIDSRDYIIKYNQAKAAYEQSKSEFSRYEELYKINKISANNYEKFKTAYINSENIYNAAHNAMKDTKLKAPFSGYIHKKYAERHETVAPGVKIVSIIDMSELDISIQLTELQLSAFDYVENIYCSIKGAREDKLAVKVKSVNKKTNRADLYGVKLSLENPSNKIKPGMSADVYVEYNNKKHNNILIPTSSIFSIEQDAYVWIYNSSSKVVNKRKIKIGALTNNGETEVLSGLKAGDIIVCAGVHSLIENQKVQLVKEISKTNIGGLL